MTNAAFQRIDHPAPAERRHWYLGRNGKQQGPFAFTEIVSFAGNEAIDPDDLVWRPGLHNWVPVETISGLLSPPPLPGSNAAPTRFTSPPPLPPARAKPAEKVISETRAETTVRTEPAPTPSAAAQTQASGEPDDIAPSETAAKTPVETAPLQALAGMLASLPEPQAEETAASAADAPREDDLPEHEKEKLRGLVSGILEPPEPQASYFVRHWRGELSFTTSLFINGVLLTAAMGGVYALFTLFGSDILHALAARLPVFAAGLRRMAELREASPPLLRLAALALPWLAAGGLYIWSLIGIFRSAINRL